ncbi:MAG TPA: hypothetical protein VF688_13200 [Allosphingosinicella sp.]|jgi:hypothetical protein
MSTQLPQPSSDETPTPDGRPWLRPAFVRLETGEAEAADGSGGDSSSLIS